MNDVQRKRLVAEMLGEKPKVNYKCKRNAPCPCGSGKKFKHCCLKSET